MTCRVKPSQYYIFFLQLQLTLFPNNTAGYAYGVIDITTGENTIYERIDGLVVAAVCLN